MAQACATAPAGDSGDGPGARATVARNARLVSVCTSSVSGAVLASRLVTSLPGPPGDVRTGHGVPLSEVSDMADAPTPAPPARPSTARGPHLQAPPEDPRGLVCPTCGGVVSPGRVHRALLAAISWFALVPAVAGVLALTVGADAVERYALLWVGAWALVGAPAAMVALRRGYTLRCRACGAKGLVAADTFAARRALAVRPRAAEPVPTGGHVTTLAPLPDGRLAAGVVGGAIRVWDPADAEADPVLLTGHVRDVEHLAVLADGRLASASRDGSVRVWDLAAGAPPVVLARNDVVADALAGLPDGRVAWAGRDGLIHLRHPDAPAESLRLLAFQRGRHTRGVTALVALPDGRLVAGGHDDALRVYDPASDGPPVVYGHHTAPVHALALLADGRLASAEGLLDDGRLGGAVRVQHLEDPAEAPVTGPATGPGEVTVALATPPHEVAQLRDGRIVALGHDRHLRVLDLAMPGPTPLRVGERVTHLAALPDGRIVTSLADATVEVWDVPGRT